VLSESIGSRDASLQQLQLDWRATYRAGPSIDGIPIPRNTSIPQSRLNLRRKRLRVLMLHNRYRLPGGEDAVVQAEVAMLRARGVEVKLATYDNDIDSEDELGELLRAGWSSAWSAKSQGDVTELCKSFHPDLIHVHNFWFRLTPAVHGAAHSLGIATVQTLHNFRLLCVNAQFLRNGKICEDCLGKAPWRGVVHRCYRNSFVNSAAVLRMIMVNRHRETWRHMVDASW